MTEIRRREGDPNDFDPKGIRHVNPAAWDLQLGWGNKSLSVRGLALVAVLAVAAVVASNVWVAYQSTDQHGALVRGQDQTSCILTMTSEERFAFRKDVGPNAFERWCWWVKVQR